MRHRVIISISKAAKSELGTKECLRGAARICRRHFIAHLADAAQGTIDTVALIFIAAQILHGIAYIRDLVSFGSLVWTIGFGATIAMFAIAA